MPTLGLAGGKLVANAEAITEWYSRLSGTIEACGQASVAMALHALNPAKNPATSAFVTQLAQETVNAHQTTDWPHTSTSPANLLWLFRQHGVTATQHTSDWETALRAFAGVRPVVVGVAHAEAFGGHDAHIDGHYVCVFGINANGTLAVGDPNTPESTQGALVSYTLAQVQGAQPFCALIPAENPLTSIPLAGPVLNAAMTPVNNAIHHVHGFSGIVQAIAADETVSAPGASSLLDLPGWVFGNMRAWLVRAIVIGVGLLLILAVLIQVIKQSDPQFWQSLSPGQAGQLAGPLTGLTGGGGGAATAVEGAGAGIPLEALALA